VKDPRAHAFPFNSAATKRKSGLYGTAIVALGKIACFITETASGLGD
jgi:hypothetical protein